MREAARRRRGLAWACDKIARMRRPLSPAVKIGLSIAVATGLYGVSFGALGVASWLGVWQTVALSALAAALLRLAGVG